MLKTMGEFFDLLSKTSNSCGQDVIKKWRKKLGPDGMIRFRKEPFDQRKVAQFRSFAVIQLANRRATISSDGAYVQASRLECEFLEEIREKSTQKLRKNQPQPQPLSQPQPSPQLVIEEERMEVVFNANT